MAVSSILPFILRGRYVSVHRFILLTLCTTSHQSCTLGNLSNRSYPTRLIDVGSENSLPRLCYSNRGLENAMYVTLSHFWGTAKMPAVMASGAPDSLTGPYLTSSHFHVV